MTREASEDSPTRLRVRGEADDRGGAYLASHEGHKAGDWTRPDEGFWTFARDFGIYPRAGVRPVEFWVKRPSRATNTCGEVVSRQSRSVERCKEARRLVSCLRPRFPGSGTKGARKRMYLLDRGLLRARRRVCGIPHLALRLLCERLVHAFHCTRQTCAHGIRNRYRSVKPSCAARADTPPSISSSVTTTKR